MLFTKTDRKCRADVVGRDGKKYQCQKMLGHRGEHYDSREGYWTGWTDADARRRAEQQRAAIEERAKRETVKP